MGQWMRVTWSDGSESEMRAHEVLDTRLFNPADFLDPMYYHFDWALFNPSRVHGWRVGLSAILSEARVSGDLARRRGAGGVWAHRGAPDYVAAERMAEQVHLDACLAQLSGDMRTPRTLAGIRNPGVVRDKY